MNWKSFQAALGLAALLIGMSASAAPGTLPVRNNPTLSPVKPLPTQPLLPVNPLQPVRPFPVKPLPPVFPPKPLPPKPFPPVKPLPPKPFPPVTPLPPKPFPPVTPLPPKPFPPKPFPPKPFPPKPLPPKPFPPKPFPPKPLPPKPPHHWPHHPHFPHHWPHPRPVVIVPPPVVEPIIIDPTPIDTTQPVVFSLVCQPNSEDLQELSGVSATLTLLDEGQIAVNGVVGFTDEQADDATFATQAQGDFRIDGINLQLDQVGSLQLTPQTDEQGKQYFSGDIEMYGKRDQGNLACDVQKLN